MDRIAVHKPPEGNVTSTDICRREGKEERMLIARPLLYGPLDDNQRNFHLVLSSRLEHIGERITGEIQDVKTLQA